MEKKIVSGKMLVSLIVGMLTLAINIQPAKSEPGTIYIRADGSIDPPTSPIQRDDCVYTLTGNIYDSIVVEKYNIVIDGNTHTLQGSGTGAGIYLNTTMCVTVRNTQIRNFYYGISLSCSSNNCIIANNITENNGIGVFLSRSSNNTLSDNNIADNAYGIELFYSSNNRISGNNITKGYDGISLSESSNYNSIIGNNITDNWYGIRIAGSANNTVNDNNIADNWYGISLGGSSNAVCGNNITANDWDGIWLYSSNNTLSGNSITANNEAGIRIGGVFQQNKQQ